MSLSAFTRVAAAFTLAALALVLAAAAGAAPANRYVVTPLVTDTGVGGTIKDTNLVNAWGLAASSSSPWWVADNENDVSTLYSGAGRMSPPGVALGAAPTRGGLYHT